MSLFFDSSALVSMAMTCSLPMLRKLKQSYDGNFVITSTVHRETIERAMASLRFRYEGHRLKELLDDGIIKLYSDFALSNEIESLMSAINITYSVNGKPVTIVQPGEISTLIACLKEKGEAFVVDEWAARLIVENTDLLKTRLEHKIRAKIAVDKQLAGEWMPKLAQQMNILRSAEFALAAWEKGILGGNKDVLLGLMWALKFAGCAITEDEINFYMKRNTS